MQKKMVFLYMFDWNFVRLLRFFFVSNISLPTFANIVNKIHKYEIDKYVFLSFIYRD